MKIPNTPKTIIYQLIDPQKSEVWNGAWQRFFDIYHAPITVMVSNSFYNKGWYGTPKQVIDEVVSEVVISLNKLFNADKYDSKKSKFRFLLKTICDRRVIDYIRKHSDISHTESIDNDDSTALHQAELELASNTKTKLAEEEMRALKYALIMDAYLTIRDNFDVRTCTAFEMIKLNNADINDVVNELGVSAHVINNGIYRIVKKLKQILSEDERMKEFYNE